MGRIGTLAAVHLMLERALLPIDNAVFHHDFPSFFPLHAPDSLRDFGDVKLITCQILDSSSSNDSVSGMDEYYNCMSAYGLQRVVQQFNAESPGRLSGLKVYWWYNRDWTTTAGMATGSTAAQVLDAYRGQIDTARSSDYTKVITGTDALGRPSSTRIGLATLNEYTPTQYLGVFSIEVKSDVTVPTSPSKPRKKKR